MKLINVRFEMKMAKRATNNSSVSKPSEQGRSVKRKKSNAPITRVVGTQSKGPRLSRLRAALLLIESLPEYDVGNVEVAVEEHGDIYYAIANNSLCEEYVEEDKNYDQSISFSMNSDEVLNSLVIFSDLWIAKGCSKDYRFGFYTPNKYTKENNTTETRKLQITWPDKAMLEYLSNGKIYDQAVLDAAKKAMVSEYENQSSKHSSKASKKNSIHLRNLDILKSWDPRQWTDFFNQIQWKFGEEDANEIIPTITDAIQKCKAYDQRHVGKEGQIISLILDRLDKIQSIKNPVKRYMSSADVYLIFNDVANGTVRLPDPAWKSWETLPKSDTRNIAEKVAAVCPNGCDTVIRRWSRRAANSLLEQQDVSDDKIIRALKWRVYDACEEKLESLLHLDSFSSLDDKKLNDLMENLLQTAIERYADCQKRYNYTVLSDTFVKDLVCELFDSCYLCFDEV